MEQKSGKHRKAHLYECIRKHVEKRRQENVLMVRFSGGKVHLRAIASWLGSKTGYDNWYLRWLQSRLAFWEARHTCGQRQVGQVYKVGSGNRYLRSTGKVP